MKPWFQSPKDQAYAIEARNVHGKNHVHEGAHPSPNLSANDHATLFAKIIPQYVIPRSHLSPYHRVGDFAAAAAISWVTSCSSVPTTSQILTPVAMSPPNFQASQVLPFLSSKQASTLISITHAISQVKKIHKLTRPPKKPSRPRKDPQRHLHLPPKQPASQLPL
ncbi:hypothetical protein BP5796_05789 [Coleophoma crateriformis]|uniref:Uncharacterized protein n=1 Tax=Coleophoma crateriformis TaxID=565419 RepID=A0A3D8RV47_9HELO|nr:hypothetical protein BP5796_05789 [Coleophoma crateriformis]